MADYNFIFDDINYRLGQVSLCLHHAAQQRVLRLAVLDEQLATRSMRQMPAICADLVDLATAVCVADRFAVRGDDVVDIGITMSLRRPEVFRQQAVTSQLAEILWWYTGDHWRFEFHQRHLHARPAESQACLGYPRDADIATEVALWSGGLDSAAGLYNRALTAPDKRFVLFGTGISPKVRHEQKETAKIVANRFPERTRLIRMPIVLKDTHSLPKNRDQRSRGFVFMLLGAVCAAMEGQNSLSLYENGIGAINLQYRKSEVGLDHSRAVHPLSLYRVADFVSDIFETNFAIGNPFEFWTKGQMCNALVGEDSIVDATASCDSRHRQRGLPTQCGCCSSCLLRRHALIVSGIPERTKYVVPHGRPPRSHDGLHLGAMVSQVSQLRRLLGMKAAWSSLSNRYPSLIDIADEVAAREGRAARQVAEQLIQLYGMYVKEWDQAISPLRSELLPGRSHTHNTLPVAA